MLRRLFILVIFFLLMLAAAVAWNIRQAGKPMVPEEIPDWKIIQENKGHMLLQSVSEPVRKTEAWLEGPDDRIGCDTLIMLAGAETGHDFFQLSPEIIQKANTIFLVQPFQNFAKKIDRKARQKILPKKMRKNEKKYQKWTPEGGPGRAHEPTFSRLFPDPAPGRAEIAKKTSQWPPEPPK